MHFRIRQEGLRENSESLRLVQALAVVRELLASAIVPSNVSDESMCQNSLSGDCAPCRFRRLDISRCQNEAMAVGSHVENLLEPSPVCVLQPISKKTPNRTELVAVRNNRS